MDSTERDDSPETVPNRSEIETLTHDGKWGSRTFRDAASATFGDR